MRDGIPPPEVNPRIQRGQEDGLRRIMLPTLSIASAQATPGSIFEFEKTDMPTRAYFSQFCETRAVQVEVGGAKGGRRSADPHGGRERLNVLVSALLDGMCRCPRV